MDDGQRRVLKLLGENPQGATAAHLAELTGGDVQSLLATLTSLVEVGDIERWQFIYDRYRLARCPAEDGEAAACFRLRTTAWLIMQDLNASTGLPVSLHQLVPGGHTVVERYPDGPPSAELDVEAARYAVPAALNAGATSLAFLAFASADVVARHALSALDGASASAFQQALIRTHASRFATSVGRRVVGAGAVTAPVLSPAQQPMAALCVYGEISTLTPVFMAKVGPMVAAAAEILARRSARDAVALLAPVRRLAA